MQLKNRKNRKNRAITGILLVSLSLIILLSIVSYSQNDPPFGKSSKGISNLLGIAGAYLAGYIILYAGYPALIIPVLIMLWGIYILLGKKKKRLKRNTVFSLLLLILISTAFGILQNFAIGGMQENFQLSGLIGAAFAQFLGKYLGKIGSIIVFLTIFSTYLISWTGLNIESFIVKAQKLISIVYTKLKKLLVKLNSIVKEYYKQRKKKKALKKLQEKISGNSEKDKEAQEEVPKISDEKEEPDEKPVNLLDELTQLKKEPKKQQPPKEKVPPPKSETKPAVGERREYQFPSPELLNTPPAIEEKVSKNELISNAQLLENKLKDFGVHAKVVEVHPGPVITLYELKPDTGVKINKIVNLADDLTLALKAKGIRIIAPIPGKGTVGIEIPNSEASFVYLRPLLSSEEFRSNKSKLSFALGKNIGGEPYIADLSRMPHLLIAGSTGSGKSVGINTIIANILHKALPTEVKLVLIDPKKLELSIYTKLRHHHLLTGENLGEDVITTPENAVNILRALVMEMENRYEILARAGVRNIEDYNTNLKKNPERGEDEEELPYIVIIIDELADLMLTAGKDIEEPIARIAQMARAVGLHLIVATQRPSVDVITGVIKANFPARIAYQTASKVDSRTILDMNGAETLLGSGDLLFLPAGQPKPERIQNAYITTEEITRIVNFIAQQPRYEKSFLQIPEEESSRKGFSDGHSGGEDEFFKEAMKIVIMHQQGSISLLQRRLKIGYSRAARIMDELEEAGIVGPYDGSKARQVLYDESYLDKIDELTGQ